MAGAGPEVHSLSPENADANRSEQSSKSVDCDTPPSRGKLLASCMRKRYTFPRKLKQTRSSPAPGRYGWARGIF